MSTGSSEKCVQVHKSRIFLKISKANCEPISNISINSSSKRGQYDGIIVITHLNL